MSSYFSTEYLNRLTPNSTRQQRIINEKEKEFQNVVANSLHKVQFTYNNQIVTGIIKTNKVSEVETRIILCVSRDTQLAVGSALSITKLYDDNQIASPWLIYFQYQDEALGYNRYCIMELDQTLDNKYIHILNPSRTDMMDYIIINRSVMTVSGDYDFVGVTSSDAGFAVGDYYEIGSNAYEINAVDNFTTQGVSYYSFRQIPLKGNTNNASEYNNWLNK